MKPRTVASLVKKVLDADRESRFKYQPESDLTGTDDEYPQLCVWFKSARAYSELKEEIDLPILEFDKVDLFVGLEKRQRYFIIWNCHSVVRPEKEFQRVRPYDYDGRDDAAILRKKVTEQEDDGAAMIGGTRHSGSGAVDKLKSDASSDKWQQEAKQTVHQSFRLTVDVLDKITREARAQHKQPMVYLRFTNMPTEKIAPDNWVIISEESFRAMSGSE